MFPACLPRVLRLGQLAEAKLALLAQQHSVNFGSNIDPTTATITLDASTTFQAIHGFCLTQTSAFAIKELDQELATYYEQH